MDTKRLIENGILKRGETRHYAAWEITPPPTMSAWALGPVEAVLGRRQGSGQRRGISLGHLLRGWWQSFRRV